MPEEENIHDQLRSMLQEVDSRVTALSRVSGAAASKRKLQSAEDGVRTLLKQLQQLDPVRLPDSVFDPADPKLFGTFAALAMVGQDRQPLDGLDARPFYGAGIYSIYYKGPFPLYADISGTETPIYVGKADPDRAGENNPKGQGVQLHGRLVEHMKNVRLAENLDIADFECRYLVVASGWQAAAESALIGLFHPIWNKETRILLGFGKHGDSAETRGNKRSPWDTLHPGRSWARDTKEDQKSLADIEADVAQHFVRRPPIQHAEKVLHDLIARIRS